MAYVQKPAAYADIVALPEHVVGEIVDGELFVSPRPSPRHAYAKGSIHCDLLRPFDEGVAGPGGWWLLLEPELHLDGNVMVPDIAGWRVERSSGVLEQDRITIAPDWICEVLSPVTMGLDRRKLMKYCQAGVEHAWLADPDLMILELFHRWNDKTVLDGMVTNETAARIPPFDTVGLNMTQWWAPLSRGPAH